MLSRENRFDIPIYLPYRKVYCNNRDGCTINKHELFQVNSNSSGLMLTLKNCGKSIEGNYTCIYKKQRATYSLNASALYIINPNNGCYISNEGNEYKCQTKCLIVKRNKRIQWELETNDSKAIYWDTPFSTEDCH
ncbi:hypothetical protein KUTeg_011224 [Tegillarca granosa]|uniref:Uncharacterized protein n=1 Tax=Tegillarca granosa TaxID=220873 RepID=A0ABQ9F1F9_TEGGR|nr:hypothetical protein KUTeg_011224 [Tegillarca granosa]